MGRPRATEGSLNQALHFPFERTVEPVPNDARMEFMFDVLDGLPPARQKRVILRARRPEVAFIEDQDAEVLLSALRLKEA